MLVYDLSLVRDWWFLNASSQHCSVSHHTVCEHVFGQKNCVEPYPSYNPDFSPYDYFLFQESRANSESILKVWRIPTVVKSIARWRLPVLIQSVSIRSRINICVTVWIPKGTTMKEINCFVIKTPVINIQSILLLTCSGEKCK